MQKDRVGLGWRPELAAGILSSLERIDVLEVVCGTGGEIDRRQRQALRLVARPAPVQVHGADLGPPGAEPVVAKRLGRAGPAVPEGGAGGWAQHRWVVRAGENQSGDLRAPPRRAVR